MDSVVHRESDWMLERRRPKTRSLSARENESKTGNLRKLLKKGTVNLKKAICTRIVSAGRERSVSVLQNTCTLILLLSTKSVTEKRN